MASFSAPVETTQGSVPSVPASNRQVFLPVIRLHCIALHFRVFPYQVITDSWARCRFGVTTTPGSNGGGDGAVKGVAVEDRASGRILAEYSGAASGTGLHADALGSLTPAEGSA